jgi:hypothetical protein
MPSYAIAIGDGIRITIAAQPGSPDLVEQRAIGVAHPRDPVEAVYVAMGDVRVLGYTFGGRIRKEYEAVITSIRRRPQLGDITQDLDTGPDFLKRCKQALDGTSIVGVPVVWDVTLVDDPVWEQQAFAKGYEMSQFGLLVRTDEPRNG